MKNKQTNKPSNSWLCSPDCAREPRGPGQALGFCTDLNCPCPGPEGSAPLSQRVTDLAPFTEETGSACLAKLRVTSGIICGVWHLLGRLSGRWKEGGPQGPRAVCGAALRAPGRPGNEGGAQTPPSGPSPSGRRGGPGACGGAAAPNGPSRATGSEGVGVHPAEGQPRWASLWARGRAPAHACARTHAHVPARTHAHARTCRRAQDPNKQSESAPVPFNGTRFSLAQRPGAEMDQWPWPPWLGPQELSQAGQGCF